MIDPDKLLADYTTLVNGTAPLVGLGGHDAAAVRDARTDLGKQTVHWDLWKTNPAEAMGHSLFDVTTLFAPGAALI